MIFFKERTQIYFWGGGGEGEGGPRISAFFTKNPNLKKEKKKHFFFMGGGGDGAGVGEARVSKFYLTKNIQIK